MGGRSGPVRGRLDPIFTDASFGPPAPAGPRCMGAAIHSAALRAFTGRSGHEFVAAHAVVADAARPSCWTGRTSSGGGATRGRAAICTSASPMTPAAPNCRWRRTGRRGARRASPRQGRGPGGGSGAELAGSGEGRARWEVVTRSLRCADSNRQHGPAGVLAGQT